MKKIPLFLILFTFLNNSSIAQEKSNPILFAEMMIGYSNGSSKGITHGGTLNYQVATNLFTYRYFELTKNRKEGNVLFIPVYIEVENVRENALLFGKRYIEGNLSYSFSAGIAHVDREFLIENSNGVLKYDNTQSVGFPYELNFKLFNSQKERYRIYELVSIGKPVGFANSIGFKLYGNISKTSFIGLGITFGIGWHKNY